MAASFCSYTKRMQNCLVGASTRGDLPYSWREVFCVSLIRGICALDIPKLHVSLRGRGQSGAFEIFELSECGANMPAVGHDCEVG